MKIMPIENLPDWEMRIKRHDAFWKNQIIDRPLVHISCPAAKQKTLSVPTGNNWKKMWYDVDYQVEKAQTNIENTILLGDQMPTVFPNIGPDLFPACYAGELVFEQTTSYIKPQLEGWDKFSEIKFSLQSEYPRKINELRSALIEAGKNKWYVGWPDLHGGGDCLSGLRGPAELCMDLFDDPEGVKSALKRVTDDFLGTYDYYYKLALTDGQPVTGWPRIVSSQKWHVPSNDFSYMIGPAQFDEFFLDGLTRECEHMDASLYHLDGPGALCHLDSLLTIEKLNAVQWVYGAGNGQASDWLEIYQKIQAAGKGIQLWVETDELDTIMENLKPEGVHLLMAAPDLESGRRLLKKVSRWR